MNNNKFFEWENVNATIRTQFFIDDNKISEIGIINRFGKVMVDSKAIERAFARIDMTELEEEEYYELMSFMKKITD